MVKAKLITQKDDGSFCLQETKEVEMDYQVQSKGRFERKGGFKLNAPVYSKFSRQFDIFSNTTFKIIISLILGLGLWVLTSLLSVGSLGNQIIVLSYGMQIFMAISVFALFMFAMFLAINGKNGIAFGVFLIVSSLEGFLNQSIIAWTILDLGFTLEEATALFMSSILIASTMAILILFVGFYLADKFDFSFLTVIFLILGLGIIIIEPIAIWIYGWDSIIVWSSIIVIIWTMIGILLDAERIKNQLADDQWMVAVILIYLDIIILAVRIFILYAKSKKD